MTVGLSSGCIAELSLPVYQFFTSHFLLAVSADMGDDEVLFLTPWVLDLTCDVINSGTWPAQDFPPFVSSIFVPAFPCFLQGSHN